MLLVVTVVTTTVTVVTTTMPLPQMERECRSFGVRQISI